ncbi:MAG TPA: hypothetical protein VMP68_25940 [Candidatus Eisenbacteria bacterium]|nr:hypothetical protein [Candidatus Eisenbacteria bacterium]
MQRLSLLMLALTVVLAASEVCEAQRIPSTIAQPQTGGSVPMTTGDPNQQQQAAAANAQRQLEIRRDTDKMAELTQELKEYLAKNDQVMSVDALKKVEQIEKLAHSVKGKMKQSF